VSNNFNNQAETLELVIGAGIAKAKLPLVRLLLLGVLAGAFIAFGAAASSVASHALGDNVGLQRFIAGVVFPVGLMLIVVVGGELFTGNCLMVEALADGKITVLGWIRNLVPVYIGNLIGSLLIVGLVALSAQLNYSDGGLGAATIKIAATKASLPFWTAFGSAILCNILVCGAVLGAFAARDIVGKLLAVFFPIMAFITCGFEHCVANMYFIPAGILASANPAYVEKAGLAADKLANLDIMGLIGNLIPVTLGNIVGGAALGLLLYYAFRNKAASKKA
jgi:formate/nitrite transporter